MTTDTNTSEVPSWMDPITMPPNLELTPPDHPAFEQIVGAIRTVYDPEIPVNIFELGLIYKMHINDKGDLSVKMTLTSPGCPVAGEMPGMVQSAVFNHVPEINDCDVEIIWEPTWSPAEMAETARLELGMF